MNATDAGPFDNDEAAAFGRELERAEPGQRLVLVRHALEALLTLDANDKATVDRVQTRAVAAAAVLGSYNQGGPPVGATEPPEFLESVEAEDLPSELVELAVHALDQIADSGTPWAMFWSQAGTLEVFRDSLTC